MLGFTSNENYHYLRENELNVYITFDKDFKWQNSTKYVSINRATFIIKNAAKFCNLNLVFHYCKINNLNFFQSGVC